MGAPNQMEKPVTLFARIEERQYQGLRFFSFKDKRSIAFITREAIDFYLKSRSKEMEQNASEGE